MPVENSTYSFPMATPKEFVSLTSVIEGVGVSTYLGVAADITRKAYLTAASSILVTKALHQSATRGAVGEIPMANVFGTPMGLNSVYTIASRFIPTYLSTTWLFQSWPTNLLLSKAVTPLLLTLPYTSSPKVCYATFVSGLMI